MKEKKILNIQIGERIKIAREHCGYTQEYFAELIDVSVQYISDLERGVVGTSIATLIKICNVLHTSSDYILFGNERTDDNSEITDRLRCLPQDQMDIMERGISLLLEAMTVKNTGK